jgi:phage-related baseplate assembly protein
MSTPTATAVSTNSLTSWRERVINSVDVYVLTKDREGYFKQAPEAMKNNVKNYISKYKMMTDTVNIREPKIVNFDVEFEIKSFPGHDKNEVLYNAIKKIKEYFQNDKMEVNQPIDLSELKFELYKVEGVMSVNKLLLSSIVSGTGTPYSRYSYNFEGNKIGDVIPPTLEIGIFELKYPDKNINGIVR